MFTFIKKVIKTGTATHAYPLEPMPVGQKLSRQAGAYATAVYRLRGLRERLPVERPDGRDRSGH
ncbi:formate hydrogenlyase complex 3 iron-sulfur protein [Klebsiella pneumoniae]|uniref:Formate hydrogenlyase complex 3 iron-sulfur protein n=1 Tax=Klebsiella pneumoniae TaxID=573 RepID=A0A378ABV9_KLEPN|nr:formate hydrogenlyase complex 3 iron-sulfur protein [Klebsiella pneumoniae]